MQKSILSFESLESKRALSVSSTVVAVVDSGADINSSYISSHLWTNPGEIPGDNIDNDNNGYVDDIHGWNFADNNNSVGDGYGHGTAVAGLASASNVDSIMILKFQNSQGVGFTGDAIRAIDYANMMKKDYHVNVGVINASWGGTTGYSSLLYDSINRAAANDIVFVAAAGNSSSNNDITPRYPSSYDCSNIISVASVNSDGTLAGYSNYGKNSVDLGTFGNSVYSSYLNNTFGYFSGTSFSTPVVSDAVAYLRDKNPSWNVNDVKSYIFSSVEQNGGLVDKVGTGGILNNGLVFKVSQSPVISISAPSVPQAVAVQPVVSVPVGNVEIYSLKQIKGWAFDSNSGNKPVIVKVLINDRVVRLAVANNYRFDLKNQLGSSYHGFNVALAPTWFHKGENSIMVKVGNNVIWRGKINK
jgi:subtilisin family serine protease